MEGGQQRGEGQCSCWHFLLLLFFCAGKRKVTVKKNFVLSALDLLYGLPPYHYGRQGMTVSDLKTTNKSDVMASDTIH